MYIERNLNRSKLVLPRPARGWRKKTGPRDSSWIAIAIASIKGERIAIRKADPTTSSTRFAAIDTEVSAGAPIESSGRPPTWSSARTPSRNSKRRGTMSIITPASRLARIVSSSCSWLAREKAMMTRSICCASITAPMSLKPPSRGRSGVPMLCTSSSTMPTGTRPNWPLLRSFVTICPATTPEPTISVRWTRSGVRCRPARTPARATPAKTTSPATVTKVSGTICAEAQGGGDPEEGPGDQQHRDESARNLAHGRGPGRELVAAVQPDAEGREGPEQCGADYVGKRRQRRLIDDHDRERRRRRSGERVAEVEHPGENRAPLPRSEGRTADGGGLDHVHGRCGLGVGCGRTLHRRCLFSQVGWRFAFFPVAHAL